MLTVMLLIAWFLVILGLAGAGAESLWNDRPIGPPLALLVPLCLYFADANWPKYKLFGGLWALDEKSAIAIQAYRVVGAFFLVEFWQGRLPPAFALPAGLGDVLVGVLAPWVAWQFGGKKPYANKAGVAWNLLGILDLVSALSLGTLHAPTSLGILAGDITTRSLTQYPLCLIPFWVVPISLMLHFRSLQGLLQGFSLARARNATLLVGLVALLLAVIAVGASVAIVQREPPSLPDRQ
jgi:hypothetical protein